MKFVSIFIGKNGNLVCIYHKYGQKTCKNG